jgi:hypothetical protein
MVPYFLHTPNGGFENFGCSCRLKKKLGSAAIKTDFPHSNSTSSSPASMVTLTT